MYDTNKLIAKKHFNRLLKLLPNLKQRKRGRPRVEKEALLNGILQVLINGVAWCKIAECGCSYASCFRYFKELQRRGLLKLIFKLLAKQKTDLSEGMIDTTTIDSFEFKACTSWDGFNKKVGTKVSLFADKYGLPADVILGQGKQHDKDFVEKHILNTRGRLKKTISFDMRYMSLILRRELRKRKIRVNMFWRDQDFRRKKGPKFRFDPKQYLARWHLERTNSWIKSFKRLRIRREYHIGMFTAFVFLALIIILIRK